MKEKKINLATDLKKVELEPLNDSTEGKDQPLPAALEPGKALGFALVGLGTLTLAEILPAFASCKYAKPVALVSGDPVKAGKIASQYGIASKNIYDYKNFDAIKNNPEIDIVYIVLPNSMHEEFTIRAANAGKHVLCEKPMATSSAEATRMIDACEKAAKKLMIAYRIQYEPNNKLAMKWTRGSEFGKVRVIEAMNCQNIANSGQWRLKKELAGGGSLPDIGLYCLNTSRYLLGSEPEQVIASTISTPGDSRFKEVEEAVFFQMHFPGGVVANCSTSYGIHQSRRYRCYGDNGGWFGLDPAFAYKGLKMEVSKMVDDVEWRSNPAPGEKNQFALEMDHMARCVIEDKKPFTPGEEGLQDHKIMEALYQSAREGKPVKISGNPTGIDVFRGTLPE
ncbi:MAG: Gfo/Idh/MocA family oxidoreductase [Chitinophagaceae bacterium]